MSILNNSKIIKNNIQKEIEKNNYFQLLNESFKFINHDRLSYNFDYEIIVSLFEEASPEKIIYRVSFIITNNDRKLFEETIFVNNNEINSHKFSEYVDDLLRKLTFGLITDSMLSQAYNQI